MTKSIACPILALLAFAVTEASAQVAGGKKPSIRLDVRNVASGRSSVGSSWADGYGSYWKNFVRSTRLEAEVGTFSASPVEMKLQWFFVGKQLSSGQRVLISKGEQPIKLKTGPALKIVLASEPVNSREVRYVFYGGKYASGTRPEGWAVRVLDKEGEQLAIRTSPTQLADVFKDPAQIEALLKSAAD